MSTLSSSSPYSKLTVGSKWTAGILRVLNKRLLALVSSTFPSHARLLASPPPRPPVAEPHPGRCLHPRPTSPPRPPQPHPTPPDASSRSIPPYLSGEVWLLFHLSSLPQIGIGERRRRWCERPGLQCWLPMVARQIRPSPLRLRAEAAWWCGQSYSPDGQGQHYAPSRCGLAAWMGCRPA